MLKIGREKIAKRKLAAIITLQSGEAENLPFEAGTFDAAIVAFGARNFENLEKGLQEMRRVLRSGGKVVVLEFSRPRIFPFKQIYFFYFTTILPLIGRVVSRHDEAYTYLPDTVMNFPDGEAFVSVLRSVGFTNVSEERLTFGIATVYEGLKQ
jgi:demethylmenaquinone methyltransferase/2-methoxy-6-polyprenyl-1,4-benzoquinol methylase